MRMTSHKYKNIAVKIPDITALSFQDSAYSSYISYCIYCIKIFLIIKVTHHLGNLMTTLSEILMADLTYDKHCNCIQEMAAVNWAH